MAINEYNSDLDVKGRVLATTVPNSTGSIVTWNSTSKVFGLRTNAQIIADLGLTSVVSNSHSHSNLTVLNGITSTLVSNWNTAFGWGNHSGLYLPLTGGTLTGKLTITSNTYQDHLELVRGSISFGIMPSTASSGELRFLATNATRYLFDKVVVAPTFSGDLTGNASTATTLATARTINGTSFNGSANITTSYWGTSRNITIGNTTKAVNGSVNVSWSLAEIGASSVSHTHPISDIVGLQTTLDDKADKTYVLPRYDSGFQSILEPLKKNFPNASEGKYVVIDLGRVQFSMALIEVTIKSYGSTRLTSRIAVSWQDNNSNFSTIDAVLVDNPDRVERISLAKSHVTGNNCLIIEAKNQAGSYLRVSVDRLSINSGAYLNNLILDCYLVDDLNDFFNLRTRDFERDSYYLDYNNFTNKPTIPTSSDFITTNTNQTGLSGDKTSSGKYTVGVLRVDAVSSETVYEQPVLELWDRGPASGNIIPIAFNFGNTYNPNTFIKVYSRGTNNADGGDFQFWSNNINHTILSNTGILTTNQIRKAGQNDTQMLLAGGGHRPVSDFALASAIPTVNNGALTLSTGTGLSGSASFTANQSGNSSFSVGIASTHKLPTVAEWAAALVNTTYTAGTGLTLTGTVFGQAITTSGSGTYVQSITQTASGFQVNLGTPPNTNTTYSNMAIAELNAGTVTSGRVISASVLNQWLNAKGFSTQTLTAGSNISIVGDVISATNTNTTYSAGTGLSLSGTTFNVNYGTTAGTSAQGNDSRINNGQTAYDWGNFRDYGLGTQTANNISLTSNRFRGFYEIAITDENLPTNIGGSTVANLTVLRGNHLLLTNNVTSGTGTKLFYGVSTANNNVPANWVELIHTGNISSNLSGYVPTSRTITAGNGLSGGGTLAANRTITLGTPGAITLASTNSVQSSSHTHAFNPGGTAAQYIRGDGTLATYANTTYSSGSIALLSTGTDTTNRVWKAYHLNQGIKALTYNPGNLTFGSGLNYNTSTGVLTVNIDSIFAYSPQGGLYTTNWSSNALGQYSLAIGHASNATAQNATAVGSAVFTGGFGSTNVGFSSNVNKSLAGNFGTYNTNNHREAFTYGLGLQSASTWQTVMGRYNKPNGAGDIDNWTDGRNPIFILGVGQDEMNRKNAVSAFGDGRLDYEYDRDDTHWNLNTIPDIRWITENVGGGNVNFVDIGGTAAGTRYVPNSEIIGFAEVYIRITTYSTVTVRLNPTSALLRKGQKIIIHTQYDDQGINDFHAGTGRTLETVEWGVTSVIPLLRGTVYTFVVVDSNTLRLIGRNNIS